MNNALSAGVSGLKAHQTMLDVSGNNLANVSTTGFKSSRVTFSDLLSQTIRVASQPTGTVGGTNPMQLGSGVEVASVDRNMSQGTLESTGQPLDMAIEGNGYFVLNDGTRDVYTRVGAFAVDSQYYLVDPTTGYRVQRIGSEGVAEGFQDAYSNSIRIPYDIALPANVTTEINYTGNLSANDSSATTNDISSDVQYTVSSGTATTDSLLTALDQASDLADGDKLTITGTHSDGTAVTSTDFNIFDSEHHSKTLGDLVDAIAAVFTECDVTLSNGSIRLVDKASGYSLTDLTLTAGSSNDGILNLPGYFKIATPGGQGVRNTNVEVFDSQGISHTLSAAFVRTDTANTWDMVITAITGNVTMDKRRISGITFQSDGAFGGITGGDTSKFTLQFPNETSSRDIAISLGTVGELDGLSQFGGNSTVAASGQDGYASGWLSSMSVGSDGVLVGMFTNDIRRDIAALKLATFQNAAALTSVGSNYYIGSANSGQAVTTKAQAGGTGSIRGESLEKSNVDVATEFVTLIEAQNGFQANARTIKVANDILQQLANLGR
jgi:flagellar hook protein FlgE